jgi:hypothetical protein
LLKKNEFYVLKLVLFPNNTKKKIIIMPYDEIKSTTLKLAEEHAGAFVTYLIQSGRLEFRKIESLFSPELGLDYTSKGWKFPKTPTRQSFLSMAVLWLSSSSHKMCIANPRLDKEDVMGFLITSAQTIPEAMVVYSHFILNHTQRFDKVDAASYWLGRAVDAGYRLDVTILGAEI